MMFYTDILRHYFSVNKMSKVQKSFSIPLRFVTKWNLRIGSVSLCVPVCILGQISATAHSIIFILGILFRYAPGVMPASLQF